MNLSNLNLESNQANEEISKYKLLSSYGGAGSIIHTEYGSIIISCIEEWGFLNRIIDIQNEALEMKQDAAEILQYVVEQARLEKNGEISISNDSRLLRSLKERKGLEQLKYLALIPDIEIKDYDNRIKNSGSEFSINSTFMPKVFSNRQRIYNTYKEWFNQWTKRSGEDDKHGNKFFPPKCKTENGKIDILVQDNIVLICDHGHISDFPWAKYLRWRVDDPNAINSNTTADIFSLLPCCGTDDIPTSKIKITSSTANASGFDGKWLKCDNCRRETSLKGLMSVKIKCPGHKPWEASTGEQKYHSGSPASRNQSPPMERCESINSMKVALTTGNNLYYSRMHSSIYLPDELVLSDLELKLKSLNSDLEKAMKERRLEEAILINNEIKKLEEQAQNPPQDNGLDDEEKDILYRFEEYNALTNKKEDEINIDTKNEHLKVKEVTENLSPLLNKYFSRILRIDNMKITAAQLDFSRVEPADSDSPNVKTKDIFKGKPESVQVYPVVESYGEGIFFSFNSEYLEANSEKNELTQAINISLNTLEEDSDDFSRGAINYGIRNNWQLYLVHTFCHLIMRELEFRCGYPTASLSERLYISNSERHKMYGCMIYTAEGAEGSMGGVIAQTRATNLNNLIVSALKRATICHSDPLCWESEGQGLFELNFASCFSCSLVSETSCEHRNIYLDRKLLVDETSGFFRDVIK